MDLAVHFSEFIDMNSFPSLASLRPKRGHMRKHDTLILDRRDAVAASAIPQKPHARKEFLESRPFFARSLVDFLISAVGVREASLPSDLKKMLHRVAGTWGNCIRTRYGEGERGS